MSIQSIGQRVSLDHFVHSFEKKDSRFQLVVPSPWATQKNPFAFSSVDVQSSPFFYRLRSLVQEGVSSGFFIDQSVDEIISLLFQEVKEGLCHGFSACLSADRSSRVSVENMCREVIQNVERPLFAQLLYVFRNTCNLALENQEWLHVMIDSVCTSGFRAVYKVDDSRTQDVVKKALFIWRKGGFSNREDPDFVQEKFDLTARPSFTDVDHSQENSIYAAIVIASEEKRDAFRRFVSKIRDLENDIIGIKMAPTKKIFWPQHVARILEVL